MMATECFAYATQGLYLLLNSRYPPASQLFKLKYLFMFYASATLLQSDFHNPSFLANNYDIYSTLLLKFKFVELLLQKHVYNILVTAALWEQTLHTSFWTAQSN